jgi:modification methylase
MPKPRERKTTSTSAFGTPGRIGHDASKFYGSRLYEGVSAGPAGPVEMEQELPAGVADRIYLKSSEQMTELPDRSVHLMITSPPYNVTKEKGG